MIGCIHQDLIRLAALDVFADVRLHGELPVLVHEHLFAVEAGLGAVVAGQLQSGEMRIVRHVKTIPECDGLVFV
ncbi:MAG: hypothetical protein ACK56I_32560, partial [bacterium]